MGDVIYDIKENCKQWKQVDAEKYADVEKMLNDLTFYDYDKTYLNSMSACGDTFKYSANYIIGDFEFRYYHVLGDDIMAAKFQIKHTGQCVDEINDDAQPLLHPIQNILYTDENEDEKSHGFETIFNWSVYTEMGKRFGMVRMVDENKPSVIITPSLKEFSDNYLTNDDNFDILVTFLTVLNAFTFGMSIAILFVGGDGDGDNNEFALELTNLESYIHVQNCF